MFEKLKYQLKTRDYFRPHESIEVGKEDFLKILRGEVVNPRRLENPKNFVDYAFMVVGIGECSFLNSWAGQHWGGNGYSNAHENSLWYGKFSCEGESRIVIPSQKEAVMLNPKGDSIYRLKVLTEKYVHPPFSGGGFMQTDKDLFTRTLLSDLSVSDLEKCFAKVYGTGFLVGKSNKNI